MISKYDFRVYARRLSIKKAPSDQLRKPPSDFPDILLEDKTIDVQAKVNQPIWITIAVPTTAKAGVY